MTTEKNGTKLDKTVVTALIGVAKEELVEAARSWVNAEEGTDDVNAAAIEMTEKVRVIAWLESQLTGPG